MTSCHGDGARSTRIIPGALTAMVLAAACRVNGPCRGAAGAQARSAGETMVSRKATIAEALRTRPFAANSPFNVPVPDDAQVDPRSDAMVSYLARKMSASAALYEFAIPIWEADESSPRLQVGCSMAPLWGTCPFTGEEVPIPEGAHPHAGSDGAMVVVDRSVHKSYEFWQIRREGGESVRESATTGATTGAWVTSWGAVHDLAGAGFGSTGSSTASGASRLGGVVRVQEIAAGVIPHALVMSIDNACMGAFRAPAVKTDGDSRRSDCTPEGARLELDPAVNVDALPGITAAERVVGHALQVYGVYVIDKGGAPMALSFELAPDGTSAQHPGAVYEAAGLAWDYYGMPHIPWRRLRVLRNWDGR